MINSEDTILVRVHALDLFSDVLGDSSSYRNGSELSIAMNKIAENKNGIIILIRDLSPVSLSNKITKTIAVGSTKLNNIREYGVGAQILSDLGVKKMTILSNKKASAIALDGFGLTIKSWKKIN